MSGCRTKYLGCQPLALIDDRMNQQITQASFQSFHLRVSLSCQWLAVVRLNRDKISNVETPGRGAASPGEENKERGAPGKAKPLPGAGGGAEADPTPRPVNLDRQ
jgi:hypothetical protein